MSIDLVAQDLAVVLGIHIVVVVVEETEAEVALAALLNDGCVYQELVLLDVISAAPLNDSCMGSTQNKNKRATTPAKPINHGLL